jgi:hypothetical protein
VAIADQVFKVKSGVPVIFYSIGGVREINRE